jgi:branched-chain amino acid transport system ATP-binding protein
MTYLTARNMTGGYGGKSTAMKAVFGMLKLRQGEVKLAGEDITHMSPQERVHHGMGFVPQNQNVFTGMTVQENLEMGAYIREDDFAGTMEQVFDLASASRSPSAAP